MNTTLLVLETNSTHNVWIGLPEYLLQTHVGTTNKNSGVIWDGLTIFSTRPNDKFIRAWQVATLFAQCLNRVKVENLKVEYCLNACIAAMKDNAIPADKEKLVFLEGIMPNLQDTIKEIKELELPVEYREAILTLDHS